jgi:hypothetical protein
MLTIYYTTNIDKTQPLFLTVGLFPLRLLGTADGVPQIRDGFLLDGDGPNGAGGAYG